MDLSNYFSDMGDRLKKIPPWGWGLLSVGVLGLVYFTSKKGKGGSGGQTVDYMVDPLAQANGTDTNNQLDHLSQTLNDRIDQIGQTNKENYQDLTDSLHTLEDAVNQHNASNPVIVSTNPTPAPDNTMAQLKALQQTIHHSHGENQAGLHQEKIQLATKLGYSVDSWGRVYDQSGQQVKLL